MTRFRFGAYPLPRGLAHGVLTLLLASVVACGGKKDEPDDESTEEPALDPELADEESPTDDETPSMPKPREPATPLPTGDGTCPENALSDWDTGECLAGDVCPLGYAEFYLDEEMRRTCRATPWLDQFGSEEDDTLVAVKRDLDGNTVALGSTGAGIVGNTNGAFDFFVRVYDDQGAILWTKQFGSIKNDLATDLALGADGRIYVVGRTFDLEQVGDSEDLVVEVTNEDGFVYCLSDEGEMIWTREISTDLVNRATAVVADSEGFVYVAGTTEGNLINDVQDGESNGFLIKYDDFGEEQKTQIFGSSQDDFVHALALDERESLVVGGLSEGSVGNPDFQGFDAFIIKMDLDLETVWSRHFGTPGTDQASAIAIDDNGTIFVGGEVGGQLGESAFGGKDFFFRSYTSEGELLWTRQYGTEGQDRITNIALGPNGLLYFAGDTTGSFAADKAGKLEGAYGVLTQDGELIDIRDFGTAEDDTVQALAVDIDGAAYLGGNVGAALPSQEHLGLLDSFVAKVVFD